MINKVLVCMLLLPAIFSVKGLAADLDIRTPRIMNVVGNWLGHDPCAAQFLKVIFHTNQTAVAALCFADEPADVFTFTWDLKKYDVICKNLKGKEPPGKIELTWEGCHMNCTVSWGKVKRSYTLVAEEQLFKQLSKADHAFNQRLGRNQ